MAGLQLRTVLLIAFHFPPVTGSSGVQRTLRFAQYLPSFGWRPIVLTIDASAYAEAEDSRGNEIPPGLEVHRAFGFDAARRLGLFGRYPRRLALPDRYASWAWWAVRDAMRVVQKEHASVLWSTFPIATAHKIGLAVARRSGLPWIAEFRDPMWQGNEYPADPIVNDAWRTLERQVVDSSAHVVVTTPGTRRLYLSRFPEIDRGRISVIENGFDEQAFRRARSSGTEPSTAGRNRAGPVRLLHSGIIYPSERDPSCLFKAIAGLKRSGLVDCTRLKVVLRASGHEAILSTLIDGLGIADIVELAPGRPYLDALKEMLEADGLLLMQAANCNDQVPAKMYEYLRAGRPILALTDPAGDTTAGLRASGGAIFARLDSESEITSALREFLDRASVGSLETPNADYVQSCSREERTRELAILLEAVTAPRLTSSRFSATD